MKSDLNNLSEIGGHVEEEALVNVGDVMTEKSYLQDLNEHFDNGSDYG